MYVRYKRRGGRSHKVNSTLQKIRTRLKGYLFSLYYNILHTPYVPKIAFTFKSFNIHIAPSIENLYMPIVYKKKTVHLLTSKPSSFHISYVLFSNEHQKFILNQKLTTSYSVSAVMLIMLDNKNII